MLGRGQELTYGAAAVPVHRASGDETKGSSSVFKWSDEQLMMQDAIRRFIADEVVPHIEELEHGDLPPYDIVRKLYATFGMDGMAQGSLRPSARVRPRGRGGDSRAARSRRRSRSAKAATAGPRA